MRLPTNKEMLKERAIILAAVVFWVFFSVVSASIAAARGRSGFG